MVAASIRQATSPSSSSFNDFAGHDKSVAALADDVSKLRTKPTILPFSPSTMPNVHVPPPVPQPYKDAVDDDLDADHDKLHASVGVAADGDLAAMELEMGSAVAATKAKPKRESETESNREAESKNKGCCTHAQEACCCSCIFEGST